MSRVAQSVWMTRRSRFDPRQRGKDFSSSLLPRLALGDTQPPVPGLLSPGLKRGRGVTLTTHPPSSAEVENE
jgi:hypothetical protein